jgi:hypothetical protein
MVRHILSIQKLDLFLVSHIGTFLFLGAALVVPPINVSHAQEDTNLISDPNFSSSNSISWTSKNCQTSFICTINPTAGWEDNTSLQISTNATNKDTWSALYGNEINVKPNQQYQLVIHMKLNQYATQSHTAIEGYDNNTKQWNQITQCPTGTNGPLEWQEYSCEVTVPSTIMKIRPLLNAGWSSQPGKQAVTLFDSLSLIEAIMGNNNLIGGFIPRTS